jgi:Amidohydrolase
VIARQQLNSAPVRNARQRTPSNLGSNSQPEREKGTSVSVASMGAIHAGCDARRVLLRLARTSSGIALAIGIFSSIVELTFHQRRARICFFRLIFSHAGGTVPMTVNLMHQYASKDIAEKLPNGIEYELKRLYYDIPGTAYRAPIAALTSLIPTSQILFGTDHPFIPLAETAEGVKQLGFSGPDLQRITRDNALYLFPQLGDTLRGSAQTSFKKIDTVERRPDIPVCIIGYLAARASDRRLPQDSLSRDTRET